MKIFLDTSSLFKLYHRETGTSELEELLSARKITTVFLSEISKIEFSSTVWKKVRTKDISVFQAKTTLQLFEADFPKYSFIITDSIIIEQARDLLTRYGLAGLRTLDSIQLSTAISLSRQAKVFLTADTLLRSLLNSEGLPTEPPIN